MSRVKVISVLNPAGPKSAEDRVLMLAGDGVDDHYDEPWPEYGQWKTADTDAARAEAARINALTPTEFRRLAAEIA